jgi:hypothetical protein
MNPIQWINLMKEWSMTPWNGIIPSDITMRQRINPDLLMAPTFQWKNEWVPLAIFKSLSDAKLSSVDVVWWHIKSRTLHREPPTEWVDFFGPVDSGHEHPYELSAYMIEYESSTKAYNAIKPKLNTVMVY